MVSRILSGQPAAPLQGRSHTARLSPQGARERSTLIFGHSGSTPALRLKRKDQDRGDTHSTGSQQHRLLPVLQNGLPGQCLTKVPQRHNPCAQKQSFEGYLKANEHGWSWPSLNPPEAHILTWPRVLLAAPNQRAKKAWGKSSGTVSQNKPCLL